MAIPPMLNDTPKLQTLEPSFEHRPMDQPLGCLRLAHRAVLITECTPIRNDFYFLPPECYVIPPRA